MIEHLLVGRWPEGGEVMEGTGKSKFPQIQKFVGGYVEMLVIKVDGKRAQLCINEEGLLRRLPPNPRASAIAGKLIVGNAVLLTGKDLLR